MSENIRENFEDLGGKFITEFSVLIKNLECINTLIFDWDGVFNSGIKSLDEGNGFNESDAMGINMLRFALWLKNKRLPRAIIVTGEKNSLAENFAKREHFNSIYSGVKNKSLVINKIRLAYNIDKKNIACFFDDINDVGMVKECGVRFLMRKDSSPLFERFIIQKEYCDYVSANSGASQGLREVSELFIGMIGLFSDVVENRANNTDQYKKYFLEREKVDTELFQTLITS
ncbi:MAG: hypothetical protein CBC38_01230 [Gammaproteobacteria bacterium TMED78]|nr:MAG: hypothetical protein CBC38_01230 [Gammaproteobacteria bacterium TMED78]|tara:strand:- start:10892 stop:11581 length:690 start_codon:yes stop_codon:yes gene_type:complete